ncbi:MAG: T9SS type A sorting domain-containing protein, partial [Bacteroidales bacterium]
NIGGALSPTGMVSLQSLDQHLIISQLSQSVGALNMQGNGVADFNVTVASTVSEPTEAQVRIQYTAGQYSVTKDYTLKIAYLIEDWENENFETFTWVNDASHPWVITDENPYEGHFAARSGNITHSQSSSLSLQVIANEDDSVSFYYFVSCEQGFSGVHYDKLEFFIDNVLQETWDGSIGWSLAAFPLLEGNHILKWSYSKDYMVSDGLDLAMIDFIKFPKAIKSGIDHAQKQSIQLSVYPNPTTDMVYLQFVDVQPEGISYQLFDIYGKLISVQSIRSTHTVVPMQNLSSGIYLLKINSGVGNEQVVKIIKN